MKDERDPPINEQTFRGGVNVVDFGDVRVAPHTRLVYDGQERPIWCKDCEKDVEAFDAFKILVENADAVAKGLARREEKVRAAEEHSLISRAAKSVDEVWRGRKLLPCCPRCGQGLFPEDFAGGVSGCVGREYAEHLRQRKATEGSPR